MSAIDTTTARPTYPQMWPSYNAAQIWEKQNVAQMLSELCESIHAPVQKRGRPRIPLGDAIFCAVMKVYGTTSGRRAMSDLHTYAEQRLIDRAPHYNTIFAILEDATITPILKALVETSARAMRHVERDFAVDSTGFSTRTYMRWFDTKYGKMRCESGWVKAHIMVGVKTKIITSIEVTPSNVGDTSCYRPLLESTAKRFTLVEVSADKAYSTRRNLRLTRWLGADPLIPFKSNSRPSNDPLWARLRKRFTEEPDEFYRRYHKRSNVETAFSMMKRKFGAFVRSKSAVAQVNELLCKALCHNLCVILEASYESPHGDNGVA
ncbi:MAG TPA: transposase [Candidatus Acidoferrales bacterium]|nr:transposase [Candidatus Acidoferrales bacterium]